MADDPMLKEYYSLIDIVKDFDQRLFLIKGWGVTASVAILAAGFQSKAPGLFLVAAISGLSFWILEGIVKQQQMRYYVRMAHIEVLRWDAPGVTPETRNPLIDFYWWAADFFLRGKKLPQGKDTPSRREQKSFWYAWPWLLPHVWLPNAITVVVSVILLVLVWLNLLSL